MNKTKKIGSLFESLDEESWLSCSLDQFSETVSRKKKKKKKSKPAIQEKRKFVTRHSVRPKTIRHEYLSGLPMIIELERSLNEHQLALHSHLQESLPPELFQDVIRALDPEMGAMFDIESESSESEATEVDKESVFSGVFEESASAIHISPSVQIMKESIPSSRPVPEEIKPSLPPAVPSVSKIKKEPSVNPYKNLRKEIVTVEDYEKNEREENRKRITHEFCEWVNNLGNENALIEESTVLQLFNTSFDTEPPLYVPFNIVSLNNVPDELVLNLSGMKKAPMRSTLKMKDMPPAIFTDARRGKHSEGKWRYGAWYLDPKLWTKLSLHESLIDPAHHKDEGISKDKKRSLALDEVLALSYGAHIFREFVEKKSFRVPEFLKHVQEIQKEAQKKREMKEVEHKRVREKRSGKGGIMDKPREIVIIW